MNRALLLAAMINVIAPAAAAPDIDVEPIFILAQERHNGTLYERAVVLAAPAIGGGHLGIVINKPTEVTVHQLFPDFEPARAVEQPVYFGGGYQGGAMFALVRADAQPSPPSIPMSPGVWLVEDAPTIDAIIERTPNQARYFMGRAYWPPGALRGYMDKGLLLVMRADPAKLFLPDTSKLYDELVPTQLPPGGKAAQRGDVDLAAFKAELRHALKRGRETFLELHQTRRF